MVDALAYTKLHTRRPVKVALPGPMTIVDSTLDEYYRGDEEALAMRLATLLNAEARDLAAAGADVIQFDEPCFNIYLDKVKAWGIRALETAIAGVTCTTAIHICARRPSFFLATDPSSVDATIPREIRVRTKRITFKSIVLRSTRTFVPSPGPFPLPSL